MPHVLVFQHDADSPEIKRPVGNDARKEFEQGICLVDSRAGGWCQILRTEGEVETVLYAHPRSLAAACGAEWLTGPAGPRCLLETAGVPVVAGGRKRKGKGLQK